MNKTLILILLPLLFMGCTPQQMKTHLLDNDTSTKVASAQRFNLSRFKAALLVKSDTEFFIPVSKKITAPFPDMNLSAQTDDGVIEKSRKDIKTFYITARHLRMNDMAEDLEIFSEVAEEYLSERIDPLLKNTMKNQSSGMRQALIELQYYKAHLLYEIEDMEDACKTLSEMESSVDYNGNENLAILTERFNNVSNSYFVMTDFSYMCK